MWHPGVTLASSLDPLEHPGTVALADPSQGPESVQARIDATRSVLARLEDVHRVLTAQAAHIEARAVAARSERDRVGAAIDAYRIEAALDEVLATTSSRVSALMKERGLLR